MIVIQEEDFSLDEVTAALRRPGVGAIVTFTGLVRAIGREGEPVQCIEWYVYEAMARKEFETIRAEAIQRFQLVDAAIVHRCGRQTPGETLVLIAAASPHRKEAFRACEYIMDEIKKRAPLWKKEIHAGGSSCWIQG